MKYITREFKIGLAAVVALCALFYGINWLKGINLFQPSVYYYVKFENINGLTVSSPVFADGVRVGIVRKINYDYKRLKNVIVEVSLNDELLIPKGSYAKLETDLMGGIKMNILLAENAKDAYQIGDTLPSKLSVSLMDTASEFIPPIQAMITKLDSILNSINQILGDESIVNSLHSIESTTANLADMSSGMDELMKTDIPQLAEKLNTIGDNFVAVSNNLKEVDYAATIQSIDATLANVKALTDKLSDSDNNLGLLFNDSALYNNLSQTAANAAGLLEDLKNHPKRYVHFSLFGKKDQ